MKTIYKILRITGLAWLVLCMVSCEDLLTEDPKGQLAVDNFFSSKGDLDLALNGLYSKVASDMYANIWAGFEAVMGDDISTHPAGNKQGLREVDTYSISDNNSWVTELWGARWRLVKAANFIIDNAGRTPDVTQEEKEAAIGQAHYWRAYSYFYLVMAWGEVPLVVKDEINYNMPLATIPEIYELIVSDLQKAEAMVPAHYTREPYARNGVNIAVSQGAVKATLAYVYMAMAGWPLNKGTEYYQLAAAKAKEVIDASKNGTYSYRLLPDYKQVYSMEYNKNNPEVLLGVYYNRGTGAVTNAPLADFLADYAYGGGGWGDTNGEIKFWYDFPEGSRKDATYFPKITLKNETQLRDWWEDPDPTASRVVIAPCFMKKAETTNGEEFDYTNPGISMNQDGEKTHQLIRLAEVYCWYAEAVGRSKTGSITEAVNLLNEVRNRANGSVVAERDVYQPTMSYDELAEAAYNEHGWEIAGYYWGTIATRARDMFRMNRIKDHFEYRKLNPEIEVAPGVFRKEAVPVSGTWSDSKMYLPRPFVDTSINPNLNN
ncbi:MAG: RagB/SusD family nutrient uptake outer membrane protein [Bacteroides sp.]|nr:RagB/SusD family nutrient uptake outer membrane protein [Bacteroides sp.]